MDIVSIRQRVYVTKTEDQRFSCKSPQRLYTHLSLYML